MRSLANKKGKKAQTWSLDLIIGVVLFLILVIVVYSLLSAESPEDQRLRQEADLVEAKLDLVNARAIQIPEIYDGDKINKTALLELYKNSSNYETLKARLGIEKDICIVVVDEFGSLRTIEDESTGDGYKSFGNPDDELKISDTIICGNFTS